MAYLSSCTQFFLLYLNLYGEDELKCIPFLFPWCAGATSIKSPFSDLHHYLSLYLVHWSKWLDLTYETQ
jgi:hypothetical protein